MKIDAPTPGGSGIRTGKRCRRNGRFHRQWDAGTAYQPDKLVRYAEKHDEAIKVVEGDYRKLPRRTRRGKRYYENARRRATQMHERRLDELFAQIACQPAVG